MSSTQRVFNGHVSFFMAQYGMWLNLLLIENNLRLKIENFESDSTNPLSKTITFIYYSFYENLRKMMI